MTGSWREEWREIETERLAAERVEADADADLEPAGTGAAADGRTWPWMSLAGALAAGLLVALVLNMPADDPQQVALPPAEPGVMSEQSEAAGAAGSRRAARGDTDAGPIAAETARRRENAAPLPNAIATSSGPVAGDARESRIGAAPPGGPQSGRQLAGKAVDESFRRQWSPAMSEPADSPAPARDGAPSPGQLAARTGLAARPRKPLSGKPWQSETRSLLNCSRFRSGGRKDEKSLVRC